MLHKSDPDLHIADWLSGQNYAENKDEEIEGMKLIIDTISMTMEYLHITIPHIQNDMHLQKLIDYIIRADHPPEMK